MPVAAIAGLAAVGTIGSAVAQSSAASSAASAQKKSANSQERANALNLAQMFIANGLPVPASIANLIGAPEIAGVSHAVLPYTFDPGFEKGLTADAAQSYADGAVSPETYRQIMQSYSGEVAGGERAVANLFNGETVAERLANFRPVADARRGAAESAIAEKNLELAKILNQNRLNMVRGGFVGDSLTNKRLNASLSIDNSAAAALMRGGVRVQNAEDERAIRDSDIQARFDNASAPFKMAANKMAFASSAADAATQNFRNRLAALDWFKTRQGASTWQPFQYQPVATTGQIIGNTVSGLAQNGAMMVANNLYQNQQQANFARLMGTLGYNGGGAIANGGFYNPATNQIMRSGSDWAAYNQVGANLGY